MKAGAEIWKGIKQGLRKDREWRGLIVCHGDTGCIASHGNEMK